MNSRGRAYELLERVLSDGSHLDDMVKSVLPSLPPEERGWFRDITAGTLRWKGRIDLSLELLSAKKAPAGKLKRLLEMAFYQIWNQRGVVGPKVVSETVELAKKELGHQPSKYCNAILRKAELAKTKWSKLRLDDLPEIREKNLPRKNITEIEALWASLPIWIWKRIRDQYGSDWAGAFAEASLKRPETWVRFKEGAPVNEDSFGDSQIYGSYRLLKGGSIREVPGFEEGHFFVQDISVQKIVADLQQFVPNGDKTLLDLCAAPGGKSIAMAWNGWRVTATDVNRERMNLMKENVLRLAKDVKIVTYEDVGDEGAFDWVWVDAPCTGTGIVRRHPDVRWNRKEKDLPHLVHTQSELIEKGWKQVKPGGLLIYSVCSVLKEEGEFQMKQKDWAKNIIWQQLLAPQITPEGDGFWAVALQKPLS